MSEQTDDETGAGADAGARALRITVARSGGVAGMSPSWTVTAEGENDVDGWLDLVESCPWDAGDAGDPDGADRIVYTIRVLVQAPEVEGERDARVPEQQLTGPWRDLVDRVKAEAAPRPRRAKR
ncbi:hypothetical protein N1028_11095 [Herbiconiux sp. CPCC 203407]|uniref:Uncharacterized protein n=1 Tax=Herbiconiux oxytropis TaxID=2970915 RepID=A0AA41XID2_9MICO|nr:protealysin inhibitor emfourin [Herbiconiux oxytropis]MCS5723519.1 hypothetical protein [Herbiconiux oxytropis]MCS5726438.1 hypothetical protein [Herbiconiux oxytropis]